MARAPDKRAEKAHKMYQQGMKLIDIANKLGIPPGTVRRWKSTYKWDGERSEKESERSDKKRTMNNEMQKKPFQEVEKVLENSNLNDKQRLFCVHYIRCFNATKAYQKAYGVDYSTAVVAGPRLLGNVRIKEEILQLKQERLNRELLSEADIFQKYMDIAFADITDFAKFGNEKVKVILKTGEQKTVTVSHVNIKNDNEVDGTIISEVSKGKDGVKIKLADRMKALQWLADHMDLATEKQKAEIAVLRAKVQSDDMDEIAEDGFIDALNSSAKEDWKKDE